MFILECSGTYEGLLPLLSIVRFVLKMVQWIVPVILIVLGTIDLVKAVIAGKDEEVKKNQQALIKRIISAVVVFLIPLIVSVIMGWFGNSDWKGCWAEANETIGGLFNQNNNWGVSEK